MNWPAITAIAELIGLIILVVSVIYLGKQVKHSNLQATSVGLQDATQLYLAQYEKSFGNEERTAFMRKALNDYTNLNQDEKGRLFSIIIGYVAAWDNLHTNFQSGFLLKETYNSITIAFASLLQTPGGLACINQVNEEFILPPYIMNNATVKSIAGQKIKPYIDCMDFVKNTDNEPLNNDTVSNAS